MWRSPQVEDAELLRPVDPPFSKCEMFVCTYEVVLSNIKITHKDLIEILEPAGPIKALNCNFGHKCQFGHESFLKEAKRPKRVEIRLEDLNEDKLAPATTRQRKLQGDGSCFNSAMEAIVLIDPKEKIFHQIKKRRAERKDKKGKKEKHYAVKSFPTTGKTQVPGTILPDLSDGAYVARVWARYLTLQGVGIDPNVPIAVVAERPIMLNFKFHLFLRGPRIMLNLVRLDEALAEMKRAEAEELPYLIRELKNSQDNQNISFKFVVGKDDKGKDKKVRVNVFTSGKVNILGANSFECSEKIYDFMSSLFRDRWDEFVDIQPLPDRARVRCAKGKQKVAKKVEPIDLSIAEHHRVSDGDLDILLGEDPKKSTAPPIEYILGLAAEFSLENPFLDQIEDDDVKDYDEYPLNGCSKVGGCSAFHGSFEGRNDVVREQVAHDKDKYDK